MSQGFIPCLKGKNRRIMTDKPNLYKYSYTSYITENNISLRVGRVSYGSWTNIFCSVGQVLCHMGLGPVCKKVG